MIHIVWEFVVKPESVAAFEASYGPDGDWARLFARHPGFLGTTLLRDSANPRRFLTIDRWESRDHFSEMRARSAGEYARLDGLFATLTDSERELGFFQAP